MVAASKNVKSARGKRGSAVKPAKRTRHHCFHCARPVTEDDLCYGCGGFVCTTCDMNPQIGFGHTVQDHKR